jgi:hypothetical protein
MRLQSVGVACAPLLVRCLTLGLLLALPQCGGGAGASGEPKSGDDAAHEGSEHSSHHEGAGDDDSSESESKAAEPKGPSCDDGTCSSCGNSICPSGWYCDEKVNGGSCSWLVECAQKPSCGCITKVLGSQCKCREEGGGLKVACE